ncbi:MAG TPA: hypothetical protein VKW04_22885 [Planctomycetota bacterium]|nr:hypothetical protein [Planctomycetota bacterium]
MRASEDLCQDLASTRRRIEQRAELLRNRVSPKELIRPLTRRLQGTLGEGGEKILDAFREDPLPLTLVGFGLGWLLLKDLRAAKPEESGARSRPGADPGQTPEPARKMSEAPLVWIARTLKENPLTVAVGALAVGMVAGLAFPMPEPSPTEDGKRTTAGDPEPTTPVGTTTPPAETGRSDDARSEASRSEDRPEPPPELRPEGHPASPSGASLEPPLPNRDLD